MRTRLASGVMPTAFPTNLIGPSQERDIPKDPYSITLSFNDGGKASPFLDAGVMQDFHVLTSKFEERYEGNRKTLGDILVPESDVPIQYYVDASSLPRWQYLKGPKREPRKSANGHTYQYSEGSMAFPDALGRPSRTILTGEGGASPSRFKHVVEVNGRLRRLVPDELDRLQGFPAGWTDTGMTDSQRAFCMGNALVVGIPHRIGRVIASSL